MSLRLRAPVDDWTFVLDSVGRSVFLSGRCDAVVAEQGVVVFIFGVVTTREPPTRCFRFGMNEIYGTRTLRLRLRECSAQK